MEAPGGVNFESPDAFFSDSERDHTEAFLRRVDAIEALAKAQWSSFMLENDIRERHLPPGFLKLDALLRRAQGNS